jgi:hypothetical protein
MTTKLGFFAEASAAWTASDESISAAMRTDAPIVLTIFGNERCVVMLDDLEAVAKAIHQRSVRERATTANPSTFGAEIEGQIRVLNAESAPSDTEAPRP